MPFFKRLVEPRSLCRVERGEEPEEGDADGEGGSPFHDLLSVTHVALARTLRQLSDLAKHACSVFHELEGDLAATGHRLRGLQRKVGRLQETCCEMDPKQEAVPVSDLDVESKLTWHYRAPWHKQRNILRPATRPPCLQEMHKDASLWHLRADGQRRRSSSRERRVTISISALPPMPMYPSTPSTPKKARKGVRLTAATSSDPNSVVLASPGQRSKLLPIPNTPSTLDKQTNWSRALPLPTPEERMKYHSRVVTSSVIPINVTGVGFDRDASVRCSLVLSQSLLQRRRKLRRRRTVAGVPRQPHDFAADSDESPSSRERSVIVHASLDNGDMVGHLLTRDSGCQTDDFLVSGGAPSGRRIRGRRGHRGAALCPSRSASDIADLREGPGDASAARLRTRSLPRDGGRVGPADEEDEAELSAFDGEGGRLLKDDEESAEERAGSGQLPGTPERGWAERARSQLTPRTADAGSCDVSSSSDTFGSPAHSVSAAGVLGGPADHKDEHQSSSGNWSGSSSTCPSQTSETVAPGTSPLARCDSELSLNAAAAEHAGFAPDPFGGLRTQRAGSFSSAAMDILEEAGVPGEGEWNYSHTDPGRRTGDLSPEPGREAESSLGCPSFASMATCESSFSDKPPSEKADTASHYSEDTEGYYTSMHFDCGLKGSRSFTYIYPDHGTLEPRCLSLRKPKAKPCPPRRSSSLRTIRDRGGESPLPKEKNSNGSSGGVAEEPPGVWGAEGSLDGPDLGVFGSADAGAPQADYADLWLLNDLKSSEPYRSLSNSSTATGTTVVDCVKSQDGSESQASRSGSGATTPSLTPAEGDFKLTGLASPSSGYSSQSETPTSAFPVAAFFPGPLSPSSAKRKPKVPERKSSLACKPDPELPAVPSSSPDLSVFRRAGDERAPIQNRAEAETANGPSLTITPAALRAVRLRSIPKELEPAPYHDDYPAADSDRVVDARVSSGLTRRGDSDDLQLPASSHEGLVNGETTPEPPSPPSPPPDEDAESSTLPPPDRDRCPSTPSPPPGLDQMPAASPGSCEGNRVEAESAGDPAGNEEGESTAEENLSKDLVAASDESHTEDDSVFLSPSKSRTTDDLFAVIHRSKRKVLGRKNSGEPSVRNGPSSINGTPPPPPGGGGAPVSPCPASASPSSAPSGPQRTPGPIYRNAKKSSTSNEEFKLLLLKKGSRSESSYRMSATEILKSPVTPKGSAAGEDEAAVETAEAAAAVARSPDAEGFFLPKPWTSPQSRLGRARVPPPANSSRYAARARFFSPPMQAISEGEAENSDGSPHDDEPVAPRPRFA
ncbi:actin remodeling regulator NHS-like isoform X2 [Hippocampus zosterae]|uniref:actin remodeling regulator NHS-like isoform X2 n=1 Tax=Hippocampus zosterae TaxID=109293 RepID=UPI00223D07A7|nr:actin remodeling regulator NHS-like isoform X2 [Hippocampus zosterae]